ncbi:MAG TPA: molecular chaperone DnaJ, partial [Candidatus Moranbacteria bacterium]|nr:molecular chaperone DnaJ [Candidatus Moranbacteria bacterium]
SGTQSGEIFRIRNAGVPSLRGGNRGHHLVKIRVVVPKNVSRREKELIMELKNLEK